MENHTGRNEKKEVASIEPTITIFPYTIFLLTCRYNKVENITTVGWVAPVCNDPPMFGIALRNNRYSLELIQSAYKDGEAKFALNVSTHHMLEKVDYCGLFSGRKKKKSDVTGLTLIYSSEKAPPTIQESPLSIEFKVLSINDLGSHSHIVGSLEKILANESINPQDFVVAVEKQYFALEGPIGDCLKVWKK